MELNFHSITKLYESYHALGGGAPTPEHLINYSIFAPEAIVDRALH